MKEKPQGITLSLYYFSRIPIIYTKMEEKPEQHSVRMPRIGDAAPEFKAVTTQGEINFPGDYSGSWVVLFSHPADFTPVCTSEFMTFAHLEEDFEKANCKLVGLSVDGLYTAILHGCEQSRKRLNTKA